jgi:hypothetical protein
MKQQFMHDLQLIYDELQKKEEELHRYYDILDETKEHAEAKKTITLLLTLLNLPRNKETMMAGLTRLVALREDALEQVMKKHGFDEKKIAKKKEVAYGFVSHFRMQRQEDLVMWIEQNDLLTPFYRSLIFGVSYVGKRMTLWQSDWTHRIIHTINANLSKEFDGNDAKVFEMLEGEGLLDRDEEGNTGDRCYSVLEATNEGYRSMAYAEAFPHEVEGVVASLAQLINRLEGLEDEVFGQKEAWLAYFGAIKEAFLERNCDKLIGKWAMVDRAWMKITTPLQVGHPLEYYEDHYRKAVALEWDLRVVNPSLQRNASTPEHIKSFALKMAEGMREEAQEVIANNLKQVDQTQLYVGQPMLYYGAEFNGLFSAQVVPNDERVSSELGKKIFAYADFVMESKRTKPIMRLSVEMFGEPFVRKQKRLIEKSPALWHQIYEISTIGHEYGHILWIDSDTETRMNAKGQFKNIEEFKATAGGLMAFFAHEEEGLRELMVDDLVSRAVGLMAWREVGEVLPYYCEGLIHLDILFRSGVLSYNEGISINYDRYEAMREGYQEAYGTLATHYIAKAEATLYLDRYVVKEGGVFLPKDEEIRAFVEHYYRRYQEIGQETF